MKNIFAVLFFLALLAGCGGGGSSDGGGNVTPANVEITCLNAALQDTAYCQQQAAAQAIHAQVVNTVEYQGGTFHLSDFIYFSTEIRNDGGQDKEIFWQLDFSHISGCEDRNSTSTSFPFIIHAGEIIPNATGGGGTNFDICAVPGPSQVYARVYEATNGQADINGPLLANAVLYFDYVQ